MQRQASSWLEKGNVDEGGHCYSWWLLLSQLNFFCQFIAFFFFFYFFQIENLYIETVILLIILFYPLLCSSSSLSYWDFWRISEERKMNQGFLPHCRVLGSAAGNTLYYRGRCRPFPLATPPLQKAIPTIMFNLKSLFSHTLPPKVCVWGKHLWGFMCSVPET